MCRRVQTGLGFGRALRVEVAEVHRLRIAIWVGGPIIFERCRVCGV